LDTNKAGNGVDAGAGGGREGEGEDEINGGKWNLHEGFWEWKLVTEKEEILVEGISSVRGSENKFVYNFFLKKLKAK